MTASLVNFQEIRDYINIPYGDTDFNPVIATIASAVSDLLEKHTRRKFPKIQYVETFDSVRTRINDPHMFIGNKFMTLWLKARPIDPAPIFTVSYSPNRKFEVADRIEIDINGLPQYEIDHEKGLVHLAVDLGTFTRALRVTYTGGYAVDSGAATEIDNMSAEAPADLKLAALIQIANDFDKQRTLSVNTVSEQDEGTSRTLVSVGGLVPEAMRLADAHKIMSVGAF